MREVVMTNIGTVNIEKLDADIRASVPPFTGLSTGKVAGRIRLHFEDTAADEQIATAQSIVLAHDPQQKTADQQARLDLKAIAQSAVGVNFNDLTTAQLKALLAVLIMERGGLNNDLTIAALGKWVR